MNIFTSDSALAVFRSIYMKDLLVFACLICVVSGFIPRVFRFNLCTLPRKLELNAGGNEDQNDSSRDSRPPIIPFEFARDDIVPKSKANGSKDDKNTKSVVIEKAPRTILSDGNPDDMRPTGYDTPDDDEEEDEYDMGRPDGYYESEDTLDNRVVKFLKDTYVGSPYDSRKKQQARYVIRNVTGISVLIGLVFTIIWYAFPGKFISVRGDRDFTERYSQSFVDPNNLLDQDFGGRDSGAVYFDQSLPPVPETTRFAPPPSKPVEAPARSVDL